MLKSSQFTRSAVIAATAFSLGASPAVARQADPARPARAATAVVRGTQQWTPPRADAMGVRPADTPAAATPAPALPVTQATGGSGGRERLLLPIAGVMLALLVILAVSRTDRRWANPFGAHHV